MKKRFISIMLVMLMALSTFGTFVFAEEPAAAPEGTDEAVLDAEEAPEAEEAAEEVTEEAEEADPADPAEPAAEEEALPAEEEATEVEEEAVEPEVEAVEEPVNDEADALAVTAKRSSGTANVSVSWTLPSGVTATKTVIKVKRDGEQIGDKIVVDPATSTKYTYKSSRKGNYSFVVIVKGKKGNSDTVETYTGTSGEAFVPGAVAKFATYSAYKSVYLEWAKPAAGEEADKYEIWCDGELVKTFIMATKAPSSPFDRPEHYYTRITHKDDADKFKGSETNFKHKYYIKAFYGDDSVKSATKTDTIMFPFKIKITFKETRNLSSHAGKKASHTFKAGDVVYATSYVRGQYHFNYKDSIYYVNYNRIKSPKATLNGRGGYNYNWREAQYFLNSSGESSMTSRLLFVNLYTQHLYVACGSKGKWRVKNISYKGKKHRDWEISSGTPMTPSPWGLNLKYKSKKVNIYTRERTVNGHVTRYWNFYHSETALHGKADNKGYGAPFSHGCIRNPDFRAIFFLNKIPLKTRVCIY